MDYIYDIETYANCFMLNIASVDGLVKENFTFTTGRAYSDHAGLRSFIQGLTYANARMVGFNSIAFDYPVLHYILMSGTHDPKAIYDYAMAVITAENKFMYMVKPSEYWVEQIDLFKIHHFDNKARMTSLKALEFNMRMDNIADLPFPVGTVLTAPQIEQLRDYCWNDIEATRQFYEASKEKIEFREKLTTQYPSRNWMNFSDVKIGKEFFQMRLEAADVQCYTFGPEGRQPIQTPRHSIRLGDCIPACVELHHPKFQRVKDFFETTTIAQTKEAFKLSAHVAGLNFDFGTGGIHASVSNKAFIASDTHMILDVDVTSLYPSIAIEHNIYPEHLGQKFVEVYRELRAERMTHKKGSAENAMLKLALNGVYGVSNDPYSVFFDPLFTMKITVGGQLMLAMLAEQLLDVPGVQIIQTNTDGITLYLPRNMEEPVRAACRVWELNTRLNLEYARFRRMHIADVNNYIAETTYGIIKRKGRYEYDMDWHQNASMMVVPKVAEQVLIHDKPIKATVEGWDDLHDFMGRVKAPKRSRFVLETPYGDIDMTDRTIRYYVTTEGEKMVKIMPPLAKKPDLYRRIGVESGWKVKTCNNISDAVAPINYDYYVQEVEKLVLGVL